MAPLFLLLAAAYFSLRPVPIEPVRWHAPPAPGYTGAHAPNNKLAGAHEIFLNGEIGPEHVILGADGKLYAAVASGHILRMKPDGSSQERFVSTGGRPVGMAFDKAGDLIVADAIKGLLSVPPNGTVTVLATTVAGEPIGFPNAAVVAGNGKIYFTDSSMRFVPAQWGSTLEAAMLDIMEQSSTGRVLEYDPATKVVRVVAKGLSLANGIALASDEQALFVSESGKYRVWKIAVAAEQLDIASHPAGAAVLFDNLPGYPDNLMRGLDGKIWLGLGGPRNDLDSMAEWPFLRKLALRIPRILWPVPKSYGHVIAFTEDGTLLADLQDPTGNSPMTTGITETADRLYIQNVNGKSLGWLPR